MLDPRIVAARIQVPAAGGQGAAEGKERIAASSQGGLMTTCDDQAFGEGSQHCGGWQKGGQFEIPQG